MGGFLVLPRTSGEPVDDLEARHARSLDTFARKGLTLDRRIEREGFVAYRFRKLFPVHDPYVEFANGDFLFATGTFIYAGRAGQEALRSFFADSAADRLPEANISGNFALVVYRNGRLRVLTDYCGYYPVHRHDASQAVSSSFLALARIGNGCRLNPQSMYEYLLHGFFVDEQTLFEGIRRLDSRSAWDILPAVRAASRTPAFEPLPAAPRLDQVVESVSAELREYFQSLASLFPGSIGSALSGGYDSRHMTALLLSVGERPHLYVYGGSSSSDVRVALTIARGEGLPIEHTDKGAMPRVDVDTFAAQVERDFYFFDGIKPLGQLDDGSDMTTRLNRARTARLQLNGAGGEIYREIWNLSDRSIDLESFLRIRYDRGRYDFLRPSFDVRAYFTVFADKVRNKLGIDRRQITRREAEMLFPFLRNHFASSNNLANSQMTDSLLPFMETRFVYPSFDIPIAYKYCGSVHAALIRKASPSLARYDSDYGINFADPVPKAYRLRRMLDRHVPHALRLFARRRRTGGGAPKPYYLDRSYLDAVFGTDRMAVAEYLDPAAIDDAEVLSRALSVELLLRHVNS